MKPFIEQIQCYAAHHQNPKTRCTHWIGVPLIILSLMILLGFVKIIIPEVFKTTLAFLTTIGLLVYYFRLNWLLALGLTPLMFFLLWVSSLFSSGGPSKWGIIVFLITFIVGWGIQIYGHYIANEKPAFLEHICQALIAPLYLMAELFFMAGLMSSLKAQLHGVNSEEDKKAN
jgi:uncharacterized membrane protein YGL010W